MTLESKQRCVIVGLGQTGLSCARFLLAKNMDVTVMDTRETPPALEILQQEQPQVPVKTAGLDPAWLQQADLIVLSPGVDPRLPEIKTVRQAGKDIVGDIEIFARHVNAPVVAITGSNGKSTVTTLMSLMAQLAGKTVQTGGNLGTPVLELLSEPAPDFYILELSSFQLETLTSLNAFAATILNVIPDHLDRYDSFESYQQTKRSIFNGDGVMVINLDDPIVAAMQKADRNCIRFSLNAMQGKDFGVIEHDGEPYLAEGDHPLMPVSKIGLAGKHNIANVLASMALGSTMGLPMHAMLSAVETFKGLPHRCHLVDTVQGVSWFNDSKATNVGSTIAAIQGLAERYPLILIAGGIGKKQSFAELVPVMQQAVKGVVLIGEAAAEIAAVVPQTLRCVMASDMENAVRQAQSMACRGDGVLLSPACASFDMFDGYEDRGQQFEKAVKELCDG